MQFADFHIHSKYSRATSQGMTVEEIARNAKIKGIDIIGTGDFTHPLWLKEIKNKLNEEEGIYDYGGIKFVPSGEISLIYNQDKKTRKIHYLILAENFSVVDQINDFLDKKGRRDYDGRPIFGFSSIELAEQLMEISKNIEIIPAHCLIPGTFIHTNPDLKTIENIQINDKVLTHRGDFKKVLKIYNRPYNGNILKIL